MEPYLWTTCPLPLTPHISPHPQVRLGTLSLEFGAADNLLPPGPGAHHPRLSPVRGKNSPLKDVHIPIPRTCEYATLPGKRDFADTVKDLVIRWFSWNIQVGPIHHKGPYMWKREARGSEREKRWRWKQGQRFRKRLEDAGLLELRTEKGVTRQGMQGVHRSWKGKEADPPLEPP